MKFQTLLQASGLVALFSGVLVGAVPVDEMGISNIEAREVTAGKFITILSTSEYQLIPFLAEAYGFSALSGRKIKDVPYLPFQEVLNNASLLFANQLVGSATSLEQLVVLCHTFDTSRLATEGYNVTLIKDTICEASKLPALQTNAEIKNLTILYNTYIFETQLNTSINGNHFLVCDFFDVVAAGTVGLNGTDVERAFQCTLPNDGPSTITTSSSSSSTTTSTTTPPVVHRVVARAAYMVPPGSPGPGYHYDPTLSIHIDARPETKVDKRIQIQPQPTESTTHHRFPGAPVVTQSPDLAHATLPAHA